MTKEINKEELLVQQEYIEKVKAINAKREAAEAAAVVEDCAAEENKAE